MLARFVSAVFAGTVLTLSPALAGMFEDAPDAIICAMKGQGDIQSGRVVFYVDVRADDGRLVYKTLGVTPVQLFVDANGMVEAGNIEGCSGQSLRELRDDGRAFDLR